MKRKGWFGTVALALVIGLGISLAMGTTQVSANTKEVGNDSMDPSDATVIELNMDVTTPVEDEKDDVVDTTEPTTTVTEETKQEETTEPATTTQETVEKEEKVETKKEETTSHGCEHKWKYEYQPATETEAGCERMDCLKCCESYVIKTYPPREN